jgi:hypothetical protein
MAPNPKVVAAFRAMSCLGIEEHKVKPVLKKLLKLYDKNWELIEEENYRALADAIFDEDDNQVYNYTILSLAFTCYVSGFVCLFTVLYHLTGVGAGAGKEKQG